MSNPLIRKLEAAIGLTVDDRVVLSRLCSAPRRFDARQDIIRLGEPPSNVHLVLDGVAYRYKLLPDGSRQIVAVLLPGDFCDLHVAILGEMDHSIATLTPCRIVDIPVAIVYELTENHPRIARGLWWATLVDEGTLREWLTSLGQRDAIRRMAHLFCELLLRLQFVGLAEDDSYDMPFTQNDLADLLGLTSVHVNRTMQELRVQELIVTQKRRIHIPDVARLKAFCSFEATYLHMKDSRSPAIA